MDNITIMTPEEQEIKQLLDMASQLIENSSPTIWFGKKCKTTRQYQLKLYHKYLANGTFHPNNKDKLLYSPWNSEIMIRHGLESVKGWFGELYAQLRYNNDRTLKGYIVIPFPITYEEEVNKGIDGYVTDKSWGDKIFSTQIKTVWTPSFRIEKTWSKYTTERFIIANMHDNKLIHINPITVLAPFIGSIVIMDDLSSIVNNNRYCKFF